ncbi:MAG: MFS transporter, partial [Acidimicrobiia bacterium]|nr:MFS transporter [Acidimicrobiia bacterium]
MEAAGATRTRDPRRVSLLIGIGLLLLTVAAFFRPPLLPEIGRDLEISPLGLGLLGSIFAVGRTAADFPAGWLSDRFSAGPMMFFGGAAIALGSLALATAPNDLVAYGSMFLLGVGSTFALTTAMAHFARAPRATRGVALSAFAAWLLAGQSLGPAAGGFLAAGGGWRLAMWVAAGLAGVVGIAFLWLRAARPEPHEEERHGAAPPIDAPRHVLALIYLLPAVQFAIGGALLQTLIPIVADAELGIGPGTVGLALGIGGGIRFVS